jgi:superfamily I DNA/RNA helicase
VLDHGGLVRAAAGLLEGDHELRERERAARSVVVVDEYQDTDPAQVRLLQALAGQGRDLVAVGDPDQSIYAFRGADVRGILDFPTDFPTAEGRPAPVVELRTCRRSGPVLLAASRAVARRLPAGRLSPSFRDLQPDPGAGPVAGVGRGPARRLADR